jgi:hypothetical protein
VLGERLREKHRGKKMATNFEFYKDQIIESLEKRSGKCSCKKIAQLIGMEAAFNELCNGDVYCSNCLAIVMKKLSKEHIEAPKLTKRERAFCEAVQTGWIARDCDMELCYFKNEPTLLSGVWSSEDSQYASFKELNLQDPFMFIRDTDAACWSVEELLKLEVEEDGN